MLMDTKKIAKKRLNNTHEPIEKELLSMLTM